MKETSFIEQNKEKWNRFEKLYESQSHEPEELSDLYMDITDDLSFAQTFYKRRTVRVYLNQLAQKVYTGVHKQKGESLKKFITVWQISLPLEIYRSRKNLLFALVAFLLYSVIGALTTHIDPDFPRTVMGDSYVDMTIQNIQNGRPLAVYETHDQLAMFINITTNNMKVAFLTFFVGFFFTIGTHILLFSNGVMLGSFQYFFHTKGLLITSFLGIWIHGAFEISAIVLAGGAGITAGNGLLFPRSYTRLQSLQLSTKRGLKIMMSLVPFIIAAGFLESYVTANYQTLPNWSKWTLILLSFAIILFFYIFYPMYVARKHPDLLHQEEVGHFKPKGKFDFHKIRDIGENISDSFGMYRTIFKRVFRIIMSLVVPVAIGIVVLQSYNHYDDQQQAFWFDWASQISYLFGYTLDNYIDGIVLLVWTLLFTVIAAAVYWSVRTMNEAFSWKSFLSFLMKRGIGIWVANIFLMAMMTLLPFYLLLPGIFIMPFFLLNGATMALDDSDSFKVRYKRGFKYSKQHYGKSLVLLLFLMVLTTLFMQPIAGVFSIHESWHEPPMRDLLDMVSDFIQRTFLAFEDDDYFFYSNIFRQVVYGAFFLIVLPLTLITTAFGFYTEREKTEVIGLKKAFKKFGKRNRSKETKVDFE